MRAFRDASIKQKLTLISLLSSSVSLVLACLALFVYDLVSYREAAEARLQAVAEVLVSNTVYAVVFDDPGVAGDTLAALGAEADVLAACLYDGEGGLFASYLRDERVDPCSARIDAGLPQTSVHRHFRVAAPMEIEGADPGLLTIEAEPEPLVSRLARYGTIAAVVMLVAGLVALSLASRLWRYISSPIDHLLDTFKRVTHEDAYDLRVERESADELGHLVEAFNEMLGEIQDRDRALQAHRSQLEESVQARTNDLMLAIEDLNTEMSQREKAEERIRWLAYYDIVTGLPNRQMLREKLDAAVASAELAGSRLALIYLDLDRFKEVNDTLGHNAGDRLLKLVGQRLLGSLRGGDGLWRVGGERREPEGREGTVSRQGGDEFTILLTDIGDVEDPGRVAQRVIDALGRGFDLEGSEVVIGTSCGIAVYPDHGLDGETLLQHADAAMYHAKALGGNSVQYFTESLKTAAIRRVSLEGELRKAIDQGAFTLFYQPKINVVEPRVTGVEALVRWSHPERGMLGPEEFVPVAEESGLIVPLGARVLEEACWQGQAWRSGGLGDLHVAVNVSGRQLRERGLVDAVERALERSGLPADLLEIEVTETSMISDEDEAVSILHTLREIGVRVALDDFGTGYSSLNLVHRLPIDTLKVDRSFVAGVATRSDSRAVVRSIVSLGQSLGLEVVAEGVETDRQLSFLLSCGCEQIQGYWFVRPNTANAIERILRDGNHMGIAFEVGVRRRRS